jgi:transposase
MDTTIKTRLGWVNLFKESNDAGYVCRRCGISRPTLRKWVNRYNKFGLNGLQDQSKRPKTTFKKITTEIEEWILTLRKKRNLGTRRIQTELIRLYKTRLSIASIHKILIKHKVKPLKRLRRKKDFKRYQRPIPGDRVQIDTCKIMPGIYQYTAVDDCTRFRVLEIYKRRTANNTLNFIEQMVEQFPFPIQRIQSDSVLTVKSSILNKKILLSHKENVFLAKKPYFSQQVLLH